MRMLVSQSASSSTFFPLASARLAVVRHPQTTAIALGEGDAAGICEIPADAQTVGHLGLAGKTVDDLLRRRSRVRFEFRRADLADRGGGERPADVDTARGTAERAIGGVDVHVLAAGSRDGVIGREIRLELAPV